MAAKPKEWESVDKPSPCWKHFLRNKNDLDDVKCVICNKTFSKPTSDTARYHLNQVHHLKVPKAGEQKLQENARAAASLSSALKQPSITSALATRESLDLVLARMTSVDRLSFNVIASSYDIQQGLLARGFKVLKHHDSIKERVLSFASKVRAEMKASFEACRQNEKFAITLDEYTSINNKRYFLWSQDFWSER